MKQKTDYLSAADQWYVTKKMATLMLDYFESYGDIQAMLACKIFLGLMSECEGNATKKETTQDH